MELQVFDLYWKSMWQEWQGPGGGRGGEEPILPAQLELWPLFSGALRCRRLSPQLGRASCGFGAQADSQPYRNLNELFSSWACRKPEKDLFYSEGGLPGSGISKCSTTASASVVLIQARQLRVSQWGLSVVQWLWELRMRIVGSCFVLLEWYSIGLQKSLPWDPDYMWYSFTYVYSKFLKTLTRENCPDVNYYSYIKIHIQKQFLF